MCRNLDYSFTLCACMVFCRADAFSALGQTVPKCGGAPQGAAPRRPPYRFPATQPQKTIWKFKKRMKELTCRSWGISNSYKVEKLNQLLRGWINYFKIGSMKTLCQEMDKHIRYRLHMCIWKHWKTPQNREKNLIKLGVDKDTARRTAYNGRRK